MAWEAPQDTGRRGGTRRCLGAGEKASASTALRAHARRPPPPASRSVMSPARDNRYYRPSRGSSCCYGARLLVLPSSSTSVNTVNSSDVLTSPALTPPAQLGRLPFHEDSGLDLDVASIDEIVEPISCKSL